MDGLNRRHCLLGAAAAMVLPAAAAAPKLEPAALPHAASFLLDSQHTGQSYRIWLGLPDGPAPEAGHPLLLALDGQAAFGLMESVRPRPQVTNAFRRSKGAQAWRPGLIVGIGYASGDPVDADARALDYTPPAGCKPCDAVSPRHGGADPFLAFIEAELLPALAALYPLDRQSLTLFGHSYGGLFTLHALLKRPALFSRLWASSPAIWFDDAALLRTLPERLKAFTAPAGSPRLKLAVGGLEQHDPAQDAARNRHLAARRMIDNARDFAALLQPAWPQLAIQFDVLAGHNHAGMFANSAAAAVAFAFEA